MSGNLFKFHVAAIIILLIFITMHLVKGRRLNKRFTKDEICKETTKTIKKVENCPVDEMDFQYRSQIMKCGNVSHVSCPEEVFVYHCVRYKDDLIEVCAPSGLITGSCCAQFNEGVGRVIEDYNVPCAECPLNYYSHNSRKYSICVKPIKTTSKSTRQPLQDDETLTEKVTEQTTPAYNCSKLKRSKRHTDRQCDNKQNETINNNPSNSTIEDDKYESRDNSSKTNVRQNLSPMVIPISIVAVTLFIVISSVILKWNYFRNRICRVCSTSQENVHHGKQYKTNTDILIGDVHTCLPVDNENENPVLQTLTMDPLLKPKSKDPQSL
ncbi:uncharacterized protein LOC125675286 [Ostrea edulis]|uniref:uncharacterized protein LOC125675286 n=1 Tax=Ostrea edulis TaxID=37623 RepID=UPI0024AF1EB7|nr:uncharacterized protein LOC125675286 [Ostrea edulis]XP_056014909.1 uncharacterized protein LOC125675286 [Ostrea edulis]